MPRGDPKHRAERVNEGLKLPASLFDALAIGEFGAAIAAPVSQGHGDILTSGEWLLRLVGSSLHGAGQAVLQLLRAEE